MRCGWLRDWIVTTNYDESVLGLGHIGQSFITDVISASTSYPSPPITISVNAPSPPVSAMSNSKTDPNLVAAEFDPLSKQRSNSDDSQKRLLDAAGMETRPRSGSLGGDGMVNIPTSISTSAMEKLSQNKAPDRPMRSVSLDQQGSQSKVDEDVVIPMAYMTLDHHLQPLPPNPKSKESVEIFDKHCEAANEYTRVQTELVLLHKRKKELAGELDQDWKDQEANFKIIEEFNNLKGEKESLVQMHRNLRAQLDLIRAQVHRKHSLKRL